MSPLLELACSGLRPEPRGGFAPATLPKNQNKTFLRRKNEKLHPKHPAPSRWSGPSMTRQKETEQNLPERASARYNNFMF
jgi:hypothetical protein